MICGLLTSVFHSIHSCFCILSDTVFTNNSNRFYYDPSFRETNYNSFSHLLSGYSCTSAQSGGQLPKRDNVTQGHSELVCNTIYTVGCLRCQMCPLQERQRLETILSLCAEYNLEDGAVELAEAMTNGLLGGTTATFLDTGRGLSLQDVDKLQRPTENDEEIQGEECSSTESTHQEVINMGSSDRSGDVCRFQMKYFQI